VRVKSACESGEASREKGGKGTQPHVEKVGLVHAFLYLYTYIYIARCLSVRARALARLYRHECGICDRDYMLRRGCPCCRD